MHVIFPYRRMVVGGAELLTINLAKTMKTMGGKPSIIFQVADDFLINDMEKYDIPYKKSNNIKRDVLGLIDPEIETVIICYFFSEYVYWCENTYRLENVRVVLYCVNCYGMIFGRPLKGFLRKKYITEATRLIKSGIKNKNIYMMDHDCVTENAKFYNLPEELFVELGISREFDYQHYLKVKSKKTNRPFTVITVARADFPFKGYILSLIDIICELIDEGLDISLLIVSYGRDEAILEKKINSVALPYQERIKWIKKTTIAELDTLYSNSHLAVGMGSAMLDCTANGTLGVPVVMNTYDCLTDGRFFYESKLFTVSPCDGRDICKESIKRAYGLKREEYEKYSLLSFEIARDAFSIMSISKQLLSGKKESFDEIDFCFLKIISWIDKIWKTVKR